MKRGYRNSFLEVLVTSNLATAINPVCASLITLYLTDHTPLFILLLIVFSGTLLIYTMNRYTDRKEDIVNNPRRFRFVDRYGKATLIIAAGFYLISLIFLLQLKLASFLIALLPMFIAILYSVFRLKRVFLLKNISVSLGLLCAVFIVLVTFGDFTIFSLLLTAFFFLTFLVNTIICDIKDVKGDIRFNISTLPGKFGLRKTKIICYFLLLVSALLIPGLVLFTPRSYLLLAYALYIGVYITFADDPDNLPSWYYGIFVDGENLFLSACCGIVFVTKILS
jgi:4-hydroxybenzoate polyprenyltransferase